MTSADLGMMEPSPFDEDAPSTVSKRGPHDPSRPMSQKDLDTWLAMPIETRVYDAYRCMFNTMAEDGIGHMSGTWRQCATRIADPTRSRYCLDHAQKMGVEYYSPGEFSELTAGETASNLTRLVPKAVRTLEKVMDDEDAPHGVRMKAADSVLDRTGYVKGVDVQIDAKVAVVDITSVISERLAALREAKFKEHGLDPETGEPYAPPAEIIEGEVVETPPVGATLGPDDDHGEPGSPGAGS